jgi:hypothetical protein
MAPDPTGTSATVSSSAAGVGTSFNGLTHRDQRLANGGNQFSLEPPDQGLCVGNGFILETVNDVLRVYNTSGSALTNPIDLNTFLGYPAQFDQTTGLQGPFVTDPNCYYDTATNRWFHSVLTIEVDPVTGAFLGPNHIDLAVSQSGDPRGSWKVYKIPAQNNGTEGTPDHHCEGGACLGDYPQLGADANAIFVTTNEYSLVTLTTPPSPARTSTPSRSASSHRWLRPRPWSSSRRGTRSMASPGSPSGRASRSERASPM